MTIRGIFGAVAMTALLGLGMALPAQATMIVNGGTEFCTSNSQCNFSIDVWKGSGSNPGGAPWGTVSMTQESGKVEISVVLNPGNTFLKTGAGLSFLFDLDTSIAASNIAFLGATAGDFTYKKNPGSEDGTGNWTSGIACSSCKGGFNAGITSLDFTVSGVTLADFITNSGNGMQGGNDFALDLCVGQKRDGSCTATGDTVVTETQNQVIPEPLTLSMFGVGLVAMGAVRRRRTRNSEKRVA